MTSAFQRLKETAKERFEWLRSIMRPDLGTHKRTRLVQAGCGHSQSLLHDNVAARHAKLLADDFRTLFGRGRHQDQLRFLTLLHAVTRLDKGEALRSASRMEELIQQSLAEIDINCLGAIEVEVVSLRLLRRIASQRGDEIRKLNVLNQLAIPNADLDVGVLVHFHGIVDLRNSTLHETELRKRILAMNEWRRAPFQLEIKGFFETRSLPENLGNIAGYLTKGGNEKLRYNSGFGRNSHDELDAQIWRTGIGRADKGAETVTDSRSLSFAEIAILDQIWTALMNRRNDNRGYLVGVGCRI